MKKAILLFTLILFLTGCSYQLVKVDDKKDAEINNLQQQLADAKSQPSSTNIESDNTSPIIKQVIVQEVAPTASEPDETPVNTKESDNKDLNDDDGAKYRDATLKQLQSMITSTGYLEDYIDIVYEYTKVDAPLLIDGYSSALIPLNDWSGSVQELIAKHLEMANSIKQGFNQKNSALYAVKEEILNKKEILKESYLLISTQNTVDKEQYDKINGQLKNYEQDILIPYRDAVERGFEIVNEDINSHANSIGNTLNAIDSSLGNNLSYSSPSYYAPTFNITRCSFSGGSNFIPLSMSCYGSSF